MEKKEKKLMLVLPCAVFVAICGIMTYFACSADDDWEGSPEYLHTHAPMLTRAGMDVGGTGATLWLCETLSGDIFTSESQILIDGISVSATFTWDASFVGNNRVNVTVNYSEYDNKVYRNLKAQCNVSRSVQEGSYPDSTTYVEAGVTITGSKYINYNHNTGQYDRIVPINENRNFKVYVTEKTLWQRPNFPSNVENSDIESLNIGETSDENTEEANQQTSEE